MVICLVLLMQLMFWALFLARPNAGSNMAARMAMIAMTTSNSIKVKAPFGRWRRALEGGFGDWMRQGFMRLTLSHRDVPSSEDSGGASGSPSSNFVLQPFD